MPRIFIVLLFLVITNYCVMIRVDNICSTQHIKRIFLKLGESGILTAYNITGNSSIQDGCQMEIVTCPSCIISLNFRIMNLNCFCGFESNLFIYNPCRCDYVWVTEPPYDTASGVSFCKVFSNSGESMGNLGYKSKTRILRISLIYTRTHVQAFIADYKSEKNRQVFLGTSQHSIKLNGKTGFFSSPFFPAPYPRDLAVEYVLKCIKKANFSSQEIENDSSCRIHLLFTDFQLASSSFMEFYDGNHRVNVITGISFRPPIIISVTNSLLIRFYASGRSSIGFKAVFSFISQNVIEKVDKPSTDCGGYVDNFGGVITMINMVPSHMKFFDCIWLIKPLKNFIKTHLYLKVTTFLNFAGDDAELEIRQGLTSVSPLLEQIHHPISQNFQEHIISFKSGYYVGLKASFKPESHFAIIYTSFSKNNCLVFSEFQCKNFRCISKKLTCDGYDHCGDNSDETKICFRDWNLDNIGRLYRQKPNYYFPKIKQFSDIKTGFVVFLLSVMGLVFIILAFAVFLYKIKSKTRQSDEIHSIDSISGEVFIEDVLIDDPPSYEPPPNYEEVIKICNHSQRCVTLSKCHKFSALDKNKSHRATFGKGAFVNRLPSPHEELLDDFTSFSPGDCGPSVSKIN